MVCKNYVSEKLGLPECRGDGSTKGKTIVATYDYVDEAGEFLFQVVRYEPKAFSQRRRDGKGEWIWSLGETRRVLYRFPDIIEEVAMNRTIFIAEGEKGVDALIDIGVPATCCPGGAGKWREEYSSHFAGANVVILPDADLPGEQHCEAVAKSLTGIAASVRVLHLPGLSPKGDPYDWCQAGGTAEGLWELLNTTAAAAMSTVNAPAVNRLQPLDIHELLALDIPPRGMILAPIIPEKGLAMLYAERGVGKTQLACGISCAVATGKWEATRALKVLHIDGEMAGSELRERFARQMAGSAVNPEPGMLKILPADLIDGGIGNLASPQVQAELDPWLEGSDLLILDNLSSLTAVIRDNDAESWNPIQEWLLRLRRRGTSVLFVHHAGKGGAQRGTSRREDVLDTSICLRRPSDYAMTEGARFEVHLEKARGIHGESARPFEAKLEVHNEASVWTIREIEDVKLARVKALLDDGLSTREIEKQTGIPKTTVGRIKKRIEAEAAAGDARDDAA